MQDRNFIKNEVQELKSAFKNDQAHEGQHKFQDELQKIASQHPSELKTVLQGLKAAGDHVVAKSENGNVFNSSLPHVELDMGKGKEAGQVKHISASTQNKFGEMGGLKDEVFDVNGKNVQVNEYETSRLRNLHNVMFNPAKELYDAKVKQQDRVDIEAQKGHLVWEKASNGRVYPLDPETSSHIMKDLKYPGTEADKVFADNCKLWGRSTAKDRYIAIMNNKENLIDQAISAVERIYQKK